MTTASVPPQIIQVDEEMDLYRFADGSYAINNLGRWADLGATATVARRRVQAFIEAIHQLDGQQIDPEPPA